MPTPLNISLIHFPSPDSVVVDETDSTMNLAKEMLEGGASHMGTAVAENQTLARGRRGKTWHTFPHHSLAFTVILRQGGAHLPLVASLAIFQTLQKAGVQNMAIKWPNDILVNGKKVCGLLAEKMGEQEYLLGIGLNVSTPEILPNSFPGTTLQAEGTTLSREETLSGILVHLEKSVDNYIAQGWPSFAAEYAQNCTTIGKKVMWHQGAKTLEGVADGLDEDGALLLNINGKITPITSGEIIEQGQQSLDIS